jgi:aminoglycoside phosphotransferase family enzyme
MLVGRHAYKVKKPVELGFLNYTTLARRYQA